MEDRFYKVMRRVFLLGAVHIGLVLALFYPLLQLQITQRLKYETLAQSNRIVIRPILPQRGCLLDRDGDILASNKRTFRLVARSKSEGHFWRDLKRLKAFISFDTLSPASIKRQFKLNIMKTHPLVVKDNLSWEEVSRFELNAASFEDFSVEPFYKRVYVLGAGASHFLGYVAPPTEDEMLQYGLKAFEILVGKQGVERILEPRLCGKPGANIIETNAQREWVRLIKKVPEKNGAHVRLSLKKSLQAYVWQRLQNEKSAIAIVLDAQTGNILAHVSHPSFDPHIFLDGVSQDRWDQLQKDPYKPLIDKGLQGLYAPGSTIKGILTLAGLKHGVISPLKKIYCDGALMIGRHPFHCWKHRWGGHGAVDLHGALMQSCDVYMYELGRLLGATRMADIFKEFGFGSVKLEGFLGARTGLIPNPGWKRAFKGSAWSLGDSILMSIGQGFVLSTPLELVCMMARLMTGKKVIPSYVKTSKTPEFKALDISHAHLNLVNSGLYSVVNNPQGTAFRWRLKNPRVFMLGKTGTSQVRRISASERALGVKNNEDLQWKQRDHALFVGGSVELNATSLSAHSEHNALTPRYAVVVVVEHGGFGGPVAGPIARDILDFIHKENNF